ncbi:MAG: hypothetical protein H0W12_04955 [Chitinophagaceae bacterium]|nr:hypothetical protein [Chitinophagaceae bacterium]
MFLKRILLLIIIIAAMFAGYYLNEFWKKIIEPRKSFARFIVFIIANLTTVFILVFLLSLLLSRYRVFFFKQ